MNFLKKHIKKILIATGLLGIAYGATLLPTPTPTLTEIPIIKIQIGTKNANIFQDKTTGKRFEIEISDAEYKAMGLKGGKQPTYPNAKWLYSYGGPAYATSTPILSDNQYFVISGSATGTGQILIKLTNEAEKIVNQLPQ